MYGSFFVFLAIVGAPLFLWLGFWAVFLALKRRQRATQVQAAIAARNDP